MELICKYCTSIRKNANSHRNHERLCRDNPERQSTAFTSGSYAKVHKRTNQYVKARQLGLPIPVVSIETRQKLATNNKNRSVEFNKQNGKKISAAINKKVQEGTWHTSLARKMHINYKGVDLHGKWEYNYCMWLDAHNISWVRPSETFEYIFEEKVRRYKPDFFLPETNEYIEIKGYKTEKDAAKWAQFPLSLRVLMKKELKELGVI